ncbi:synapse-associated protein 1-like [Liolophura sinensis]|uniref:synapse-associated protein 1-like n=1 Tax=Liolophura sinensis TaxID=3198878 RepID=UPI00315931D2
MFSSVTSWLGVGEKSEELTEKSSSENKENTVTSEPKGDSAVDKPADVPDKSVEKRGTENNAEENKSKDASQALEDVSALAVNTAKEWGSYLYSFGKIAGQTVASTATKLKHTVEEKTLLGEFSKEQDKFVTEKKEKKNKSEAAVPPWVGYNEEEQMKAQILALSKDKRNFMRNPPSGVQFNFDFQSTFPVAVATLQEDSNLQKMRFELVPKQITEETFWRNYFYRVSLIKQSTQLTSLAQQSGNTGESRSSGSSRRSSSSENGSKEVATAQIEVPHKDAEELPMESPQESEFISDAFSDNHLNEDDLRKEMQQLGMQEDNAVSNKVTEESDIPEWEQELQKELQEYEVVSGGIEDEDLENEILQQLEEEEMKER